MDCSAIASPAVPTCYSPFQHPELASDDGRRLFVTFTRLATYDTLVYELTFGTPIHEYRAADDRTAYGATPPNGSGWQDDGIVFYASDAALPGFVAVYRWERDGDVRYAASSPGNGFASGDLAFYAASGDGGAKSVVRYRPVFDWWKGDVHLMSPDDRGLEEYGYERGRVLFYAP